MQNLAQLFQLAGQNFTGVIGYILSIVQILNPLLFIVALLTFFWGLSKFILSSGNAVEVQKGKSYMLWGILVLFILLSFMAIIKLVSGQFEFIPVDQHSVLPTNAS